MIAARVIFGHLPDRLGGARVALVSVVIEAAGLALIWLASGPVMAATGAVLTGFGYSLVYPGLGVEAVRRAPPDSRGLAMGIYTAFLDVALGLGSPALGLIAGWAGLSSVFLASTLIVLCATAIAVRLLVAAFGLRDSPQRWRLQWLPLPHGRRRRMASLSNSLRTMPRACPT